MFRFKTKQIVADVAGTRIGGQPGENATALAGTVFYAKHKIVEDEKAGRFNVAAAETLIKNLEQASDETKNPALLQVFFATAEAAERYVDFCSGITDMPLLLDSPEAETRIAAARYASETGIADRCIYNSINVAATKEELAALRGTGVYSCIALGFNPVNKKSWARVELLENGAGVAEKGVFEMAADAGMKNVLVDPAVTPFGQGAGAALRAMLQVKAKYGYPVGCGVHNAASSWKWLKGRAARKYCDVAANALPVLMGCDFVLFGPIENAAEAFPVAAMADIFVAEMAEEAGTKIGENHPAKFLV